MRKAIIVVAASLALVGCPAERTEQSPGPRHGGQVQAPPPSSDTPSDTEPGPEPEAGAEPSRDPEPGTEGASCGTRGAAPCAPELFCMFPESARCGEADAPGTCQPRPEICTRDYTPVCGCDGRTHGNRCAASAAGVSVRHAGACAEDEPH
jgi:hypothetical protein